MLIAAPRRGPARRARRRGWTARRSCRLRQPQPMQPVRLSRSRCRCRMRSSRSWRQPADSRAQSLLVGTRSVGQRGQRLADARQRNAEPLRHPDERDPAQRLAGVAALVARRAPAGDQALAFVEVQAPRRPRRCDGTSRRVSARGCPCTSTIVEVADRVTVLDVTVPALGVNSEVGALRVVILHRPGAELQRLTPRNNDALLFDGLPWVARAQEEHDAFADAAAVARRRGAAAGRPADRGAGQRGRPHARHLGGGRLRGGSDCRWRRSFRRICGRWSPPRWRRC